MSNALPAMNGLLALGTSGPFSKASQRRWFPHEHGTIRYLDMRGYRDAMVEGGAAPHAAADTVLRMAEHGCEQVLWALANGGRRGHVYATWDVRVAMLTSPAATGVPYVTGSPTGTAPVGATTIAHLTGQPGVLNAYRSPMEPQRLRGPGPTKLSRALGVKGRVKLHVRQAGYASLAVGHAGATATVLGGSPGAVEDALARLVAVLVADMQQTG